MEMGSKFGGGEEQKVEGGEAVAMEVDGELSETSWERGNV